MTPRVSPGSSNTTVVEVIFPFMISQDRQMLVYVTNYIRTRMTVTAAICQFPKVEIAPDCGQRPQTVGKVTAIQVIYHQ